MLAVVHVLGSMLMLFSITYVLPIATSLIYRDGLLLEFVAAAMISLGVGAALWVATRRRKRELRSRDGFLLVSLGWALMSAIATVPLLMALPGLSFTDAFFETMSGLSTTGATVLTGIDNLPPSINLWRHALCWYGGMGIIVLVVAILPLLGVGGMQLYKAETPGPVKNEKLTPRITQTAKALWFIYFLITAACVLSLKVAGMDWFDAVCHAFAALALGGFSTHDASIGYYDSVPIEAVLIVFMLIAAMNFSRHFIAWQQKSLRTYATDTEAKAMLLVIGLATLGVTLFIWHEGVYASFPAAFRHVAFNLVSIATDCGFVSQDYAVWPVFAPIFMLMLSCYCANTGSTGGGIKMFRTLVLFRQAGRELLLLVHPQAVRPVKIAGQVVQNQIVFAVLAFVVLYFGTVVVLTFSLLASGLDF
ncbi:MAG TPA: potassium transporter TrkG, partial [Steroidobacteraceae bacterium]|nr:potassium transporter TrkG [Steroidobacteraceae bacterium]